MARSELEVALREGGSAAQLKRLLAAELKRSATELKAKRSGYEAPVTVAIAVGLDVVVPVPATPGAAPERGERLVGALVGALGDPLAGVHDGYLALHADGEDPELVTLLFEEAVADIDRLRARALIVPAAIIDVTDLRPYVRPRDEATVPAPHDDPDPGRRVARRMLLTLRGKGKWGGYHTEFTNLARGFQEEWELAERVGERMVIAGLLIEKPSVGQRHVSLNPRRKGEIDRLIEDAELPEGLTLPPGG
jgi:hypothetical protein